MAAPDAIKPTAATETADIDVEKGRRKIEHRVRTDTSSDVKSSADDLWLQITDVDFQGKFPRIRACVRKGDDNVEHVLSSLPELAEHTARIYDYTIEYDYPHLESLSKYLEPYASSDDALRASEEEFCCLSYGFDDMRWQWSDFPTDHKLYSSILIRDRTTDRREQYLYQDPNDQHEGDLITGDIDDSFYRLSTCLKCCAIGKEKLIVLHRYHTLERETSTGIPGRPRLADILCDEHSITALSDGSRLRFTKLAVLDLLKFYVHDLRTRSRTSFAVDDAKWSATQRYTSKVQLAASLSESADILKDAIDYVIGSLDKESRESDDQPSAELGAVLSDLQLASTRLKKQSVTNLARHQRNWDIYLNTLNVHESEGVKRLTLLAAVFLPLSLSASILAMNTRFVNLRLLLFDFLGVFVLLGSITILFYIVIVTAIKIARWVNLNLFTGVRSKYKLRGVKIFTYSIFIIPWALAATAFTVGMVKNVTLGLKILGYSFAGLLGLALLWFPATVTVGFVIGFVEAFGESYRAERVAAKERRDAAGPTKSAPSPPLNPT